ncbi:HD domain-containing phosphohydrolase [Candidatus Chlorohelix sp.]|uniref:HD domain-containing phosphohydrolase n=1 Tax=Candidatus Chlorohelix sp. TaxID=3139201 RepID=UPI003052647C
MAEIVNLKPSILIVDDDLGVRNVIARMLTINHYRITDVDNAEKALELIKNNSFDLIISDIHMPGMSGLEFLEELKKTDPGIACIIITSNDNVDVAIKALKAGALGFIPKPFTGPELIETINAAMYSAQLMHESMSLKMFFPLLENASLALLNALEAKDHDSQGHSQRVANYSRTVAENPSLGLTQEAIRNIYLGGLFHDIGKISVPDKILHKANDLTTEEYKEMSYHPEIGARILGRVEGLEESAIIIAQHHERLDGSGYPYGLKGDEIILGARIVGIADAFDDMTSKRVYADGLPKENVIGILIHGKGRLFDSALVDIFLDII